MGFWELIVIAIGVSMDAFAVSICKGLSVEKVEKKHLLSAGLWFGGSQALMPLLGYLLGNNFQPIIERGCQHSPFSKLSAIISFCFFLLNPRKTSS